MYDITKITFSFLLLTESFFLLDSSVEWKEPVMSLLTCLGVELLVTGVGGGMLNL